jgi:hypothetical protein
MPGRPLKEFEKVVPQLERVFGSDVSRLRADAERLLRERHRVVHSVMLLGTDAAGSARYEAWHPKSNATEPVEARRLYELAHDLAYAEMDVRGLTTALLATEHGRGEPSSPGCRSVQDWVWAAASTSAAGRPLCTR